VYCLDSSAFIDAWVRRYPPDFLPSLWEGIANLITDGVLVSPEEVLLELERGNDELYKWAVNQPTLFRPPTFMIQVCVAQIVNTFPTFVPPRAPDGIWADPYVIALAQEVGAAVVTTELLAPPDARYPKIPNICNALGIRYLTPLQFIRERGWRF
jgi:Domain of unknown function (DUF4411)